MPNTKSLPGSIEWATAYGRTKRAVLNGIRVAIPWSILVVVWCLPGTWERAYSQIIGTELTGIVSDSSGARIPEAAVTVTNQQTGARRELLDRLPAVDPQALHALGDTISGSEPQKLESFVDAVNAWLAARLENPGRNSGQLFRLAEAWERINAAARDVDIYNLERKPLVFRVFSWLAEAAHG